MYAYLAEMDEEIARPTPAGRLITERARKLEREAKRWQKEYHSIMGNMVEAPDQVAVKR